MEGSLLRRVYERFLRGVGSRVELARLLSEKLGSFQWEEWTTQKKRTGRAEIPRPKVDEIPLTETPNAPVLKNADSYQEQARHSERLAHSP